MPRPLNLTQLKKQAEAKFRALNAGAEAPTPCRYLSKIEQLAARVDSPALAPRTFTPYQVPAPYRAPPVIGYPPEPTVAQLPALADQLHRLRRASNLEKVIAKVMAKESKLNGQRRG